MNSETLSMKTITDKLNKNRKELLLNKASEKIGFTIVEN